MPSPRRAFLLLALAVALPAWAGEQSMQIIGWSADEQRFAMRLYDEDTSDFAAELPFCPGYVNHEGKPFRGSLKLGVYEQGKKPTWFPIQDLGKCTPPQKSRERLDKVKQELARLGIDLAQKQPGTELTPDEKGHVTLNEGPGAPLTFESEKQVKTTLKGKRPPGTAKTQEELDEEAIEDEHRMHLVKGELVVFVRKGGERNKLLSEPVNASFLPAAGDQHDVRLHRVWRSPSGKKAVFLSGTLGGGLRAPILTLRLLGVVSVDGPPVVLR